MSSVVEDIGLGANRNFRAYFSARIVSQLGDQLYVFAISWYVLDLTKSGLLMAALLAVNALAVMAVAPFGGLIADRVSRKWVMVGTDIIQGVVLLALLLLHQERMLSIEALYAATALLGLCSAVFSPAANAIVPGIVAPERVPDAVAAGQAAANLCTIAGMILGGALYRLIGIAGILVLNAASNLAAAAIEARIRVAPTPVRSVSDATVHDIQAAGALERFAGDLRDGLRQVRSDKTVFTFLMVNTVFTFAALPIAMVYIPYLFNVVLGGAPLQSAFPQAATWAGIIAGSFAAAGLLRRRKPETLIAGGLAALAFQTILVAGLLGVRQLLGPSWMSAACTLGNAIAGAAASFFVVPVYAVFHSRCRDEFRGRFWGLESALRTAAMCAGYFVAGLLAQRLPLTVVFAGTGTLMLCLSAWIFRLRPVRAPAGLSVAPPG
jgi:DHA3 family macrolide efflux protein-like MFS transporter